MHKKPKKEALEEAGQLLQELLEFTASHEIPLIGVLEIDTPNLDRLGAGGFRASQFYNTPRCCPSRACLLTGLYPHQAGVGMMVYRDFGDGYQGGLE